MLFKFNGCVGSPQTLKRLLELVVNSSAESKRMTNVSIVFRLGFFKEQIKELQQAIQDNTRKLEEVRQERLRAEEDIIQWYGIVNMSHVVEFKM